MGILLLAAIFLTSAGVLVRAAVTPPPSEEIAPAATVSVSEGERANLQQSPWLFSAGTNDVVRR
jgi:hypothetical protein